MRDTGKYLLILILLFHILHPHILVVSRCFSSVVKVGCRNSPIRHRMAVDPRRVLEQHLKVAYLYISLYQ